MVEFLVLLASIVTLFIALWLVLSSVFYIGKDVKELCSSLPDEVWTVRGGVWKDVYDNYVIVPHNRKELLVYVRYNGVCRECSIVESLYVRYHVHKAVEKRGKRHKDILETIKHLKEFVDDSTRHV